MLKRRVIRRVANAELPPAVVIGTGVTGLTLARALRKHGVPVIGVDHRRRRYTSYSGAFHLLLVSEDEFFGPAFVEFLFRLADLLPGTPTLFLSMDEQVKLVAAHGRHLDEAYHFEFPTREAVDLLMSKEAFSRLASRQGWPIPRTWCIESLKALDEVLESMSFPVILKPRVKNLAFRRHSPRKAFRCDGPDRLISNYRLIAEWEPEAIVQEWIPGDDDQVYFSFHYFDRDRRELCSFQGRKIRQYRPRCGSTSSAVGVEVSELGQNSRAILRTAGCVGFGAVEYKRHAETGEFYITEPTVGRVNLQVGVALANDMDIVSRAYFHLIERPYPVDERPTRHRKWILLKSDLKSARYYIRRSDRSWLDYWKSIRGPKVFAVWRPYDYRLVAGFLLVWITAPLRLLRHLARRTRSRIPAGSSRGSHTVEVPVTAPKQPQKVVGSSSHDT